MRAFSHAADMLAAGKVRRVIEYVFYRILAFVVPLLPRRSVVWLGRRLGGLYYLLSPRSRAVGMENLARALPERDDHRRILLNSLRIQGVALLDTLWSVRVKREDVHRYVEAPSGHEERLRGAQKDGRGAVVASAHLGSWEILALAGGAWDIPRMTIIARPIRNAWIDRHFKKRRERTGNRIVDREGALTACVGALRRGEYVCSVIDMAILPEQGGVFVEFFGMPALTATALTTLAVRRATPLLLVVCLPLDKGRRFRLDVERFDIRPDADRNSEILRLTRELNLALERRIRAQPEAWIWSYKRWKYRPVGATDPYHSYSVEVEVPE